jgi:hypothetical protein
MKKRRIPVGGALGAIEGADLMRVRSKSPVYIIWDYGDHGRWVNLDSIGFMMLRPRDNCLFRYREIRQKPSLQIESV